jgi:hypothetical protein
MQGNLGGFAVRLPGSGSKALHDGSWWTGGGLDSRGIGLTVIIADCTLQSILFLARRIIVHFE